MGVPFFFDLASTLSAGLMVFFLEEKKKLYKNIVLKKFVNLLTLKSLIKIMTND